MRIRLSASKAWTFLDYIEANKNILNFNFLKLVDNNFRFFADESNIVILTINSAKQLNFLNYIFSCLIDVIDRDLEHIYKKDIINSINYLYTKFSDIIYKENVPHGTK